MMVMWNSLPQGIVMAPDLDSFKRALGRFMAETSIVNKLMSSCNLCVLKVAYLLMPIQGQRHKWVAVNRHKLYKISQIFY